MPTTSPTPATPTSPTPMSYTPPTPHPFLGTVYHRGGAHTPSLRRGYQACRRATRRTGEIEYPLSLLLPPPLRLAAWALYGAVRTVDDLADADPHDTDAPHRLDAWITACEEDLRQGHSTDPVRQALIHTLLTWNLQPAFLHTLFEQLRQDTAGRRFATWREWQRYNRLINTPLVLRTASLVMRATGVPFEPEVLAAGLPGVEEAWQQVVDALYLTDALVDLADDLTRGHVPLPDEALDEAEVSRTDLLERRHTPAFARMVDHLTDRATAGFRHLPALPALHPAISTALTAYADLYRLRLLRVKAAHTTLLHTTPRLRRRDVHRVLAPARAKAAIAWSLFPLPVRPAPLPTPARVEGLTEKVRTYAARQQPITRPTPHPSGVRPPRLPAEAMPRHVAIIMDGNGRWATARGLPRTEGHRAGANAVTDVVHGAVEIGLENLTLYMFSTENWKRPADEIQALMYEIPACVQRLLDDSLPLDIRVRWAGLPGGLPADVRETLTEVEQATRHCTGLTLTACVNYGGRAELTFAARQLTEDALAGKVEPSQISEHLLAQYLHVPELPDVDLLLRTGGDQRVSNFLPWQAAYAELVFVDTCWPDIDRRDLWRAIEQYAGRTRRYGSVPRQPQPPADVKAPARS
ncbi:di-trans,poly-cis-decaprenylcistransferase [Streptomyces spinoverrucosus]|uniref:polyprenyl diphosphate synthase n=1 Tax=Streptomyces spinoverrucosus TaxID=284043 RepID=UPI0018C3FD8A|nr:polyprenyl diphosphate synthase [Streptomyces spinoverrucosus]MBG0851283.1 di-trans,poly-cis-decaprenylcistransferase [Streptomyces spinoverrucosus]